LSFFDVLLQLLKLFLTSFALCSCDLSFHLLDLEVSIVQQFLLALFLDLELGDVGLQVSACRQSTRDVSNQVGLVSSQLKKLLGLFEELFLLRSDFLLDLVFHLLRLFVLVLSQLVHLLQLLLSGLFFAESLLGGSEFLLCGIKTLHLFGQNGVDRCNVGAFVVQLSCKC
jgi:hypothetical protein